MEKLIIKDTLTQEGLIKSGLAFKQTENFGMSHNLERELKRWGKYNPTYYIVDADPKHNYGLDFKIFIMYKADGINFFKEVSFSGGGSITSRGLRRVTFEQSVVIFGKEYYDKGQANRPALREASDQGWIFN